VLKCLSLKIEKLFFNKALLTNFIQYIHDGTLLDMKEIFDMI